MTLEITSLQNPRIKRVTKLAHRSFRDEVRQTVVEGVREITLALDNGMVPVEAYICRDLAIDEAGQAALDRLEALAATGHTELFDVTPELFDKIAYRGGSGGLLLVVPYVSTTLTTLTLPADPFLVVVEDAQKPGNLGAILRTADAAGVDAVIIPTGEAYQGTDSNNPNVIRASLGAAFTVPQVMAPVEDVIGWLRQLNIPIVASTPDAELLYTSATLSPPVAIVMGSEAWGLSNIWLEAADTLVRIPMSGAVDSLNLSTATALLLYEVVRQSAAG